MCPFGCASRVAISSAVDVEAGISSSRYASGSFKPAGSFGGGRDCGTVPASVNVKVASAGTASGASTGEAARTSGAAGAAGAAAAAGAAGGLPGAAAGEATAASECSSASG